MYVEGPDGDVERREVRVGEVASSRAAPSTIRNESGAPARALAALVPGLELEAFARDASALGAADPV